MKTIITKSAICVILATLLSGSLNAQTYPDYVLGSSNLYTYSSIVRCYSPTEAVSVSYHYQTPPNSSYSTIHVVGLSTNEYSIDLEPGYCVFDMEIANGYLVMCGRFGRPTSYSYIPCHEDIPSTTPPNPTTTTTTIPAPCYVP